MFLAVAFIGSIVINYLLVHRLQWKDVNLLLLGSVSIVGYPLYLSFSKTKFTVFLG